MVELEDLDECLPFEDLLLDVLIRDFVTLCVLEPMLESARLIIIILQTFFEAKTFHFLKTKLKQPK